ncbi:helix-turn-helix domain-containing protein [Pseudodesulfovibrio pelocollis]|uniref:helix-turn-helix domain-containing protein n=1 Tax=Pseudodesulfovibrio pelocollis TaxID=3051432 RepID=UPI00255ABEE2|nr:helix-turn-helix domain-containing protein [Pseudodesulfovibrio sp. SB368]
MSNAKKKGGRPPEYDEKYAAMAREMVAESNLSQSRLAKVFGVGKTTITDWKREHPEFAQALAAGEESYKVKVVEQNLYRLCKGIRYTVTTETGKVKTARKMFAPPNPKAIEFFLSRRAPERWPSVKQIDLTGNMNLTNTAADLAGFLDGIDGTTQGLTHNESADEQDVEAE